MAFTADGRADFGILGRLQASALALPASPLFGRSPAASYASMATSDAATQKPAGTDDVRAPGSAGDLTLRAGADGSTARVHRGVMAAFSRVLGDVLGATECDELPLPGKTKAQLDLLVAWFYRQERFSMVRITTTQCRALASYAFARCVASRPAEECGHVLPAGGGVRHPKHAAHRGQLAGGALRARAAAAAAAGYSS